MYKNRKRNFFVAIAAAMLTFAALYGTLGCKYFNIGNSHCGVAEHCCMQTSEHESCKVAVHPAACCTKDSVEKK